MRQTSKNGLESYHMKDVAAAMRDLYGDRYVEYRRKWDLPPEPGSAPLHLDIDLRDACNQKCAMCHQTYRARNNICITRELLDKAINEAAAAGVCSVNIGASCEPLLEPELSIHAFAACTRNGIMDTFIHTNGILLTKDVIAKLLTGGLKHLCISLDAVTAETYSDLRRSDAFRRVEKNIEIFLEMRGGGDIFPELRVSFCLTPVNRHERDVFLEKWSAKADLVEFQDFRPVDGVVFEGERPIRNTCREGIKRGMLWPNGDITPCCGVWEGMAFGNITEESFPDVWYSKKADSIRQKLREGSGLPRVCEMCLGNK